MNLWNSAETWAVQSVCVMAAAGLITLAMRRCSAAARHLVWIGSFILLLALPILPIIRTHSATPVIADRVFPSVVYVRPGSVYEVAPAPQQGPELSTYVVFLWAAVAAVLLLQIGLDLQKLSGMRTETAEFRSMRGLQLPEHLGAARSRARLLTAVTDDIRVPVTWGVFRPVVVLPSWSASWPEDRFHAIVLHELAHVSRNDFGLYLVSRIACCLFWFNPLAWYGLSRLRSEAETATDDQVLVSGPPASTYAGHLVEIAQGLPLDAQPGKVPGFAAVRRSELERRIRDILRPKPLRLTAGYLEITTPVIALVPILLLLPVFVPQIERRLLPLSPRPKTVFPSFSAPRESVKTPVFVQSSVADNSPPELPLGQGRLPSYNGDQTIPVATEEPTPPSVPADNPPSQDPSSRPGSVSGSFQNADVRAVLNSLFHQAGFNYSIDPDVQGTVSTEFRNIPPEMALSNVCRMVGAAYAVTDGIYVVHLIPKN